MASTRDPAAEASAEAASRRASDLLAAWRAKPKEDTLQALLLTINAIAFKAEDDWLATI
jgi:hypothetical protein